MGKLLIERQVMCGIFVRQPHVEGERDRRAKRAEDEQGDEEMFEGTRRTCMLLTAYLLSRLGTSKSNIVTSAFGTIVVTISYAHRSLSIVPTATPQNMPLTYRRPNWVLVRRTSIVVFIVPVGYPFLHIACHVVSTVRAYGVWVMTDWSSKLISIAYILLSPLDIKILVGQIQQISCHILISPRV